MLLSFQLALYPQDHFLSIWNINYKWWIPYVLYIPWLGDLFRSWVIFSDPGWSFQILGDLFRSDRILRDAAFCIRYSSLAVYIFMHLRPWIFIDPKCRLFIFLSMVLAMWISTGLLCQFEVLNLSVIGYVFGVGIGLQLWARYTTSLWLPVHYSFYTVLTSPKKDKTAVYRWSCWFIPTSYLYWFNDKLISM